MNTPKAEVVKAKTLEVRINSVQDAMSCVQNSIQIAQQVADTGAEALTMKIALEVRAQVMPILAGVFRCKAFYVTVRGEPTEDLFVLPAFVMPEPVPAPLPTKKKLVKESFVGAPDSD